MAIACAIAIAINIALNIAMNISNNIAIAIILIQNDGSILDPKWTECNCFSCLLAAIRCALVTY